MPKTIESTLPPDELLGYIWRTPGENTPLIFINKDVALGSSFVSPDLYLIVILHRYGENGWNFWADDIMKIVRIKKGDKPQTLWKNPDFKEEVKRGVSL